MLSYPIDLEDDDGTVLATSPDFPELTTFGDDRDEALERAIDALEEAIAARIHMAQGHSPALSRQELRHTSDAHRDQGNPLPGNEGPGDRQGGPGPAPRVAPAAGRSRAGRAPPFSARPDGRRIAGNRPATGGARPQRRLAESVVEQPERRATVAPSPPRFTHAADSQPIEPHGVRTRL